MFKTQDNLDQNRCPINKVTLKLNLFSPCLFGFPLDTKRMDGQFETTEGAFSVQKHDNSSLSDKKMELDGA